MPKVPERKARTHRQIVEAASRRMREVGPSGAGVTEIMAAAGLTHGGFYAHFADKDALVAEAVDAALAESREHWLAGLQGLRPEDAYRQIVGRYLSRGHRDALAAGCPMPALGSEISRHPRATREAFEKGFVKTGEAIASYTGGSAHSTGRERALAMIALAVGGLTLSRMVADLELSDSILLACRRAALATLSPDPASR